MKKIRAERARARQRERRGLDLRPRYREGDLPATANIGVVTIEDPYQPAGRVDKFGNLHVEAQLEPVRHRDGSLSEGAPAWTPPTRPPLTAIRNLREDTIGRMHARRHVDEAQYSAARAYQQLFETATISNLSPTAMRPRVDGGSIPDPISDARRAATRRPRSVESNTERLARQCRLRSDPCGAHRGKSVEKTARAFGASSTREVWTGVGYSGNASTFWPRRWGFRTMHSGRGELGTMGMALLRIRAIPSLRAGSGDLADPQLRRGRPGRA